MINQSTIDKLIEMCLSSMADAFRIHLGIPLRLIYKTFRNFQVSAIAYSDFGIELTSLHKKPKVQYELSGLRTHSDSEERFVDSFRELFRFECPVLRFLAFFLTLPQKVIPFTKPI